MIIDRQAFLEVGGFDENIVRMTGSRTALDAGCAALAGLSSLQASFRREWSP